MLLGAPVPVCIPPHAYTYTHTKHAGTHKTCRHTYMSAHAHIQTDTQTYPCRYRHIHTHMHTYSQDLKGRETKGEGRKKGKKKFSRSKKKKKSRLMSFEISTGWPYAQLKLDKEAAKVRL